MKRLAWAACGVMLAAVTVGAQERKRSVTLEWMFSDSAAAPTTLASYAWLRDGTAIIYDRRVAPERRTFERLDPRTGARSPALDMRAALASLGEARGGGDLPKVLEWPVQLDSAGRWAVYAFGPDAYRECVSASSASSAVKKSLREDLYRRGRRGPPRSSRRRITVVARSMTAGGPRPRTSPVR